MAKTLSTMLPLGTPATPFCLMNVTNNQWFDLKQTSFNKGLVIAFICNHCPYVKHINAVLVSVAEKYQSKGIKFIAINSNDTQNFPDDGPEQMKIVALEKKYPFPYLFDADQSVAKAYHAACTPDFYLFDSKLFLVYRGQFDDARPGNDIIPSGNSLQLAMDCLLSNKVIDITQKPSLGCNIKWKNDSK